jgi:hypothetical protein
VSVLDALRSWKIAKAQSTAAVRRAERRRPGPKPKPALARAQQFLRDALGRGPRSVSDIEEAAAKAHVELLALEKARADLGIVTSRANTGGVHAVQWSLPG